MCGRSSLTVTEKELEKAFDAQFYSDELERYNPLPNFNVAPSHIMPVIPSDDKEHFRPHRWGLIPFWADEKNIGYKMINARIETVLQSNAYRVPMKERRCLVPMDGYYEWKATDDGKQPFRIQTTDQEIFMVAGLWEEWEDKDGEVIRSYTVIVQDASESISHIHDRMPALLLKDQQEAWLDLGIPAKEAISMIEPYPDDLLTYDKVSRKVNNVKNNEEELVEPID